jgi:thioredoxin reductase (NADPH)
VAVIGGGSSALTAALHLANYASKVYIIHRRNEFRGEPVLVDKLEQKNIEKVLECTPEEIKGDKVVKGLVVKNCNTNKTRELPVSGVFVYVGVDPASVIAKNCGVAIDERGYIKVNEKMETNVSGIYACGDITGRVLQVATATGEGCTAAWYASPYVREHKK